MRNYTTLFICAALAISSLGEASVNALPKRSSANANPRWMDPSVNEINRLPMRSTFIAFPEDEIASSGADFTKSGQYMNIGGKWKFHWMENADGTRPEGFHQVNFDDSKWGSMPVPGLWELNGYGDPLYTNTHYPWENFFRNNPPFVPIERNHVGLYRHNVEVPASWAGKDIFLHIGSATSNLTLWVNGKEVGYSQDSKLEAEFDVTSFVKAGKANLVAMEIYRWCDGSYLEDQDFWRLSGIGRECYIYCRERSRFADIKITPDLSEDYIDGEVNVKISTAGKVAQVKASLYDAAGAVVDSRTLPVNAGTLESVFQVARAHKWSAEDPYLYRLELSALRSNGTTIEHTAFNVGIRKVEIKNRQLLVNGQPVLIKGVDRHELNENTGYYLTKEDMMRDIKVLKSLNINAVRTCHYPDDALWYDLCDIYGIYLVDEGNIESHGMGYGDLTLAKDPAFLQAHLLRDKRMVLRDYNHPSVIIWSLGNEAGNGQNFYDCYDWIKAYDKSRPVQYERACQKTYEGSNVDRNTDIVCPMYANYDWCEQYSADETNPRPLIQCEYAHAMGNSMGGFKEYWDLVRKYPAYQGGFIWDFADQAFAWKNPRTGKITYRFGGDYNSEDIHDANFNCNGIVAANRDVHPCTREVKYQYQNIWTSDVDAKNGIIRVFNENFFISTAPYALEWNVTADGQEVLHGRTDNLDIAPQSSAEVKLDYNGDAIDAIKEGEILLNVRYVLKQDKAPLEAGFEAAYQQICIRRYDFAARTAVNGAATAQSVFYDKDNRIVGGNGFSIRFDSDGWLCSYFADGLQMISEPLKPQFYRALTDNDNGVIDNASRSKQTWLEWRDTKWENRYFSASAKEETVTVTAKYRCKRLGTSLEYTYVIFPDGKIKVSQKMNASKSKSNALLNMLRYGMQLAMPGEFDTVEFYGAGPWENYIDRNSGAPIGHYTQSVDSQYYPYYVACGESGTHSALRWWVVRNAAGKGLKFSSSEEFSASAIPYPMEQIDRYSPSWKKHPSELKADGQTHVNVDYRQQGMGCVNSWGRLPRKEYMIPYQDYNWEFQIEKF